MGRIRSDRPANLAAREGDQIKLNTGYGKTSDDSAGGRDQHAGTGRDDDLNCAAVHTRYQHRDLVSTPCASTGPSKGPAAASCITASAARTGPFTYFRFNNRIASQVITISSDWLNTSYRSRVRPRPGRVLDGSAPKTSPFTCRASPGRTGRTNRTASNPGDPMEASVQTPLSKINRSAHPWSAHRTKSDRHRCCLWRPRGPCERAVGRILGESNDLCLADRPFPGLKPVARWQFVKIHIYLSTGDRTGLRIAMIVQKYAHARFHRWISASRACRTISPLFCIQGTCPQWSCPAAPCPLR